MLEMLYPFMMIRISITKGNISHRWIVDKKLPEYYHMINSIRDIILNNDKIECKYNGTLININTKLWEHQNKTINKIFTQMTINNKRGFGDASHVGAGKTLCALGLMAKLHNYIVDNVGDILKNYF